jgi:hypothetical protein
MLMYLLKNKLNKKIHPDSINTNIINAKVCPSVCYAEPIEMKFGTEIVYISVQDMEYFLSGKSSRKGVKWGGKTKLPAEVKLVNKASIDELSRTWNCICSGCTVCNKRRIIFS